MQKNTLYINKLTTDSEIGLSFAGYRIADL